MLAFVSIDDAEPDAPRLTVPLGEGAPLLSVPGYEIWHELARGGMGIVYRARQIEPAREVAIKMLLPHAAVSAELHARFRQEAQTLAGLDHPGILPIYEFGEYAGLPWFSMRLAAGGSLADRVAAYAGRWRDCAELVASVADAVQFAHDHGVLHRDLKPANVLFDDTGRAFVADFGLAKLALSESAFSGSMRLLGTPQYLAPEVANADARAATTASDVYGLGAILYELLSGRPPFVAASLTALLRQIAEKEPPSCTVASHAALRTNGDFPGPPRDLELIARKCLAKIPSQRYASASVLACDLRRWLDGLTIEARPATQWERARSWIRHNRPLALVGAGFVVLLTVALVAQAVTNRRLRSALNQSILSEARLTRRSGRAGQQLTTLGIVGAAAEAGNRHWRSPALWRDEVAAALALPDFQTVERWPAPALVDGNDHALAANGSHCLRGTSRTEFGLLKLATKEVVWHTPKTSSRNVQAYDISTDSRWVSVSYDSGVCELHDTAGALPTIVWHGRPLNPPIVRFAADSSFLVVCDLTQGLLRVDLPQGFARVLMPPPPGGFEVPFAAIDPGGKRLAFIEGTPRHLTLRAADTGALVRDLGSAEGLRSPWIWSPDGTSLLLARDRPVPVVEVTSVEDGSIRAGFHDLGHNAAPVGFGPDGQSVVVIDESSSLIWRSINPIEFRVELSGVSAARFSQPAELIVATGAAHLSRLSLVQPFVFRIWHDSAPRDKLATWVAESPDGRWVVVTSKTDIFLWNRKSRRLVQRLRFHDAPDGWPLCAFTPDSREVLVAANEGILRFRLGGVDAAARLSAPEVVAGTATNDTFFHGFSFDQTDWIISLSRTTNGNPWRRIFQAWPGGDESRARDLTDGTPAVGYLPAGPRFGITAHQSESDVRIWDWKTGRQVGSLGLTNAASCMTSPDGRWLLSCTEGQNTLWETASWRPRSVWKATSNNRAVNPVFSPDSRFVLLADDDGSINIHSVPDCERVVTLVPPHSSHVNLMIAGVPGGSVICIDDKGNLSEWDISALNQRLRPLGLDWLDRN